MSIKMNRRGFGRLSSGLAAGLMAPGLVKAQATLPSLIKIVVPFAPGGSNDVFARALAEVLGPELKTTFIVENRPGAGGVMGSGQVVKAPADGSTLLLTSNSIVTGNVVQAKPPFDLVNSFTHLAILNRGPSLIFVKGDSKYTDLPSLFDAMRKGEVRNYGSAGIGTNAHLAGEMLNYALKTEVVHVPYRGIANVAVDIIGNNVDMTITTPASVSGQMRSGHLKALGVTSPQVSPFFPGLKPVAEFLPGYEVESWWGVFAPPRTPAAIADTLNRKINEMVMKSRMADLFKNESTTPVNFSVEQVRKFVGDERDKWLAIAKARNIQPV